MLWYDHNMGWWGYAGMGIGMALFWALVLVGVVAVIRFAVADRGTQAVASPPPPEQVLADRFARGELTATEYRDRLTVLRDHAHH